MSTLSFLTSGSGSLFYIASMQKEKQYQIFIFSRERGCVGIFWSWETQGTPWPYNLRHG
jgi:hypothetical protein